MNTEILDNPTTASGGNRPAVKLASPIFKRRAFSIRSFSALLAALSFAAALPGAEFEIAVEIHSPSPQFEDRFGVPAAVPDVNGDGKPEILIAAPRASLPGFGEWTGRVFLFDGATRELLREFIAPIQMTGGGFGAPAAGIQDLNGNGSGEVMLGALISIPSGYRVYVFDGATADLIHTIHFPAWSLSAMEDLNGDGLPEILMGDHGDLSRAGVVKIFDGATGAELRTMTSPDVSGAQSFFGYSSAGIGDVNGDGIGDVVVGDWRINNEVGAAYIMDGANGALLRKLSPPAVTSSAHFGRSVAALGDVNEDGIGDVAVGANDAGQAYVFDGATGELLHTLESAGGVTGFGWGVSAVPDIDGDGRMDVIVTGFTPFNMDRTWPAQVFSGATGQLLRSFPGQGGVAGLPDIDGDGKGEILIHNANARSPEGIARAGKVTLYLSRPPGPPSLQLMEAGPQSFRLTVSRASTSNTRIQATSDFLTWEAVATVPPGSGPAEVEDSDAANHPRRFYRAVETD